jgi:hypothetical protein
MRSVKKRGGWQMLAFLLALLQTYPLAAMQIPPVPPLTPAAQRIKDQVNQIAIGSKLTVRMINGTEYHGHLQAIDPREFSIREVDLKAAVTIPYDEAGRVSKDYGRKGFAGHRVDPKRSLIIGAVFVATLLTIVFVLVANDKS